MAWGFSDILSGVGLLSDLTGGGKKENGGAGSQSATRDPWGAAQPYILRGLQDTSTLNDYYQQNPFSDLQKKYYGQQFSDIDNFRNVVAPGLMSFANSGMTGGYQRGASTIPQRGAFSLGPSYSENTGNTGNTGGGIDPFASVFKPTVPTVTTPTAGTNTPVNRGGSDGGSDRGRSALDGSGTYDGIGLGFDTGPGLAAMGRLGQGLRGFSPLTGAVLGVLSDIGASLNNGYGALSGLDGYADPRDAAAKGLGVGNTAPTGVTADLSSGIGGLGGGGGGLGGGGGAATGGRDTGGGGRDASGGGDRGTRGGFAKGGYVTKGLLSGPDPKGPDDGAANLDAGEYVIKKSAVKKIGKKKLDKLNKG